MGRRSAYWILDASLLDALRAIGYGTLRYWTPCGLLDIGYWILDIGRPAGYWRWDASLLGIGDGRWAMGDWTPHSLIAL